MEFDEPAVAQYCAEEIMDITQGRLAAGLMSEASAAICSDTRILMEGDWFLALPGRTFDGHDFLGDAFAAGAVGAIVTERPSYPIGNQQFPLIAVDDTRAAYYALARNWRRRINPLTVAICGITGQAVTASMCQEIMGRKLRCHSLDAQGSNNCCLPAEVLAMKDDTQALILPLAAESLEQMSQEASCLLPDIAIITSDSGRLCQESSARQCSDEIFCQLLSVLKKPRGVAILGQCSERMLCLAERVCACKLVSAIGGSVSQVSKSNETTVFRIEGSSTVFEVRGQGPAAMELAWCAIMAGREAGLSDEIIAAGLGAFVR